MEVKHPYKSRFCVSLIMIILAVIGLVIADVRSGGALFYWKWVTPAYAILAISLSWYLHHRKEDFHPKHLLQELFHWVATVGGVYLFNLCTSVGIMGRFEAALSVIIILGLSTFLAGLYIEMTLTIVGVLLGAFAASVAIVDEYLYSIMIPLTILAIILIIWMLRTKHKRS